MQLQFFEKSRLEYLEIYPCDPSRPPGNIRASFFPPSRRLARALFLLFPITRHTPPCLTGRRPATPVATPPPVHRPGPPTAAPPPRRLPAPHPGDPHWTWIGVRRRSWRVHGCGPILARPARLCAPAAPASSSMERSTRSTPPSLLMYSRAQALLLPRRPRSPLQRRPRTYPRRTRADPAHRPRTALRTARLPPTSPSARAPPHSVPWLGPQSPTPSAVL